MSLSPSLVSPSTVSPRPNLVLALTARERQLFFPDPEAVAPMPRLARATWSDDADLADTSWENFLRRAEPTILLTGWNTPPLPAS